MPNLSKIEIAKVSPTDLLTPLLVPQLAVPSALDLA